MSSKNNTTLSAEQQKLMEIISQASAALAALSAGASLPKKGGRKPKSTPSADAEPTEKKPLNPKIAAMNEERMAIFAEMKSAWSAANPSAATLEPKELKERIKKGEFPPLPTFPEALKEHSRRMRVLAPLHDQKAQFRRDAKDLLKGELLPAWIAGGKIGREPSLWIAKQELQRRRALSEPKITVISDPEVFDKILEINGNKFALNSLNWVIDGSKEWVGLWDPVKKVIDTTAPAPDSDDE